MTGTANNKRFGRQQSLRRPPVEKGRWAAKGTKPLPDQASIKHIISVMIIHLCRKVLFIETRVKITLYSLALFFGSLVFDFMPVPRTYLSLKDNIFNLYFVKIGWAWLLFVVGSFVYLTSATYGCGKSAIIQQHMGRLFVGTIVWGLMTQWLFVSVESATGTCLGRASIVDKWACITSGFQWHAFDISGHAFLLVYMNLVTVEEAQAIVGWETIREMIFHEEHHRKTEGTTSGGPSASSSAGMTSYSPSASAGMGTTSGSNGGHDSSAYSSAYTQQSQGEGHQEQDKSPLRSLTNPDFFVFKGYYEGYTPYIRTLFIFMTFLSVACDVLLACTVIYFHTMPQKVVGGGLGMAAWYITYRVLFRGQWPGLPGEGGLVRYQPIKDRPKETHVCKKKPVLLTKDRREVPMFMGMPLYGAVKKEDKPSKDGSLGADDPDGAAADAAAGGGAGRSSAAGGGRRSRFPPGNVWR